MRVLSVVGNRPQFVKSAPLSTALRAAGIDETVVHTGQHYDRELSQVFFDELGLVQPVDLGLQTADIERMRSRVEQEIERIAPERVIVFGDTNSTLAGARAAVAQDVPVAHVEAGLRSGDLSMPEEHNRIEVDRIADLLLCPDERSAETLRTEGVPGRIVVVGDVMYDACLASRPGRTGALDGAGRLRARARPLRARHDPPGGERPPRAPRAHPPRPVPAGRARPAPGPSAHGRRTPGPRDCPSAMSRSASRCPTSTSPHSRHRRA